jgi:hypothetical protein
MVTLRFVALAPHCQIDDFGLEVERSVAGSLHFHPNSIKVVTDSEWKHIQEQHPDLACQLQVISKDEVRATEKPTLPPLPEKEPEPVEASPVSETVESEPESEPEVPAEHGEPSRLFQRRRGKKR